MPLRASENTVSESVGRTFPRCPNSPTAWILGVRLTEMAPPTDVEVESNPFSEKPPKPTTALVPWAKAAAGSRQMNEKIPNMRRTMMSFCWQAMVFGQRRYQQRSAGVARILAAGVPAGGRVSLGRDEVSPC